MLKNKKILVTGGAGFLGIHLVQLLIEEENVPEKNIFIPRSKDYDLRKKEDILRVFSKFSPDIVIHLATTAKGIGYNKEHPASLYYDHIMMNSLLIEISKQKNVEKFVGIGTALAYPSKSQIPLKEDSLWGGYPEESLAPLGLANKMMLVQFQAYRTQFGFNAIYIIPANIYGPGDNFSLKFAHVIPATITKFDNAIKDSKDVEIWGTGEATREFLYVLDAARGIIKCIKDYNSPEPINLGTGEETTIKEMVQKIAKIMKFEGNIIWDVDKPVGQQRRYMDNKKILAKIGFKAEVSFEEGLEETIKWYLKNKNNL